MINKTLIGILFILTGLLYGSLSLDQVYNFTLGYMLQHNWINLSVKEKISKDILGRKFNIILYSLILITIGIFILWNRNS